MQLAWGNGLISLFPMLSKTFEHVQPCIQRHQLKLNSFICFHASAVRKSLVRATFLPNSNFGKPL